MSVLLSRVLFAIDSKCSVISQANVDEKKEVSHRWKAARDSYFLPGDG
jgi:hypothetical protein